MTVDPTALQQARRFRRAWIWVGIAAFVAYIPLHAVQLLDPPVLGLVLYAVCRASAWHGWIRAQEGGKP